MMLVRRNETGRKEALQLQVVSAAYWFILLG